MSRLKILLDSQFFKNTLKLSTSSVVLTVLPLLVTPILSRLYSPEEYGDWGVFSGVLYIVSSFILLSYENAIVKTNEDEELPPLIALCTIILVIISVVVFVFFKLGSFWGIKFFVEFPSLILLIPVIITSAFYTMCYNLSNRQNMYNAMATVSIVNGTFQSVFRILLGVIPIVSYGLIVGNLVAQVLATLLFFYLLRNVVSRISFKGIDFEIINRVAIKYKKFPLYDAPARFIEQSINNMTIVILAFFWAKEDIGCFSMVMLFVLIPISIIGSAMGNVFYREISENAQNFNVIKQSTLRVGKINFIVSIIPILFLALGGDRLLVLFLGDRWGNVAPMSLCMALFSVPVILSEPLLPIFRTLDKQEIRFRINTINLITALGLLIIMALSTHHLYMSLIAYSIVYAIMRFIMFNEELSLAGLHCMQISKWFRSIIVCCYVLAIARIIPYLL